MELRHLRYFVALAEHLSFTRAAARVHVTQSTLSHQIRQLEDEVGQTLFDRIGKKVVTTEAGELFLGFATRALQEVDHGIATLKPTSRGLSGQVRSSLRGGSLSHLVVEAAGVDVAEALGLLFQGDASLP